MAEHRDPAEPGIVARWRELSPVRAALYPVVVALVALLVAYGQIAADRSPLWLALAAACLGTAGIEAARRVAWSPASVAAYGAAWEEHAAEQYARGVADALHVTPDVAAGLQRCRDIRNGQRCELSAEHEGGHLIRAT